MLDSHDDTCTKDISQRGDDPLLGYAKPKPTHLRIDRSVSGETAWVRMQPPGRPSVTFGLLDDLLAAGHMIQQSQSSDAPIRHAVLCCEHPEAFNLGGDLAMFARCIEDGDRAPLQRYASLCIDVTHWYASGLGSGVETLALVQGHALGGGFEGALSCHGILAERRARFGLPESLFNLFPGMGAYSFLSRRLGPVEAERMIMSGRVYTAAEMHEMGLVDILAEDGEGEAAVHAYFAGHGKRMNTRRAVIQARRFTHAPPKEEMAGIIDLWVQAAFRLRPEDLKMMRRLVLAQDRSMMAKSS